jgi:predicted nucleic acid-binding protein
MVVSWLLDPRPLPQAEESRRVIDRRTRVVSFMTVTELRYGALKAGWGELRRRRLERSLADLATIQTSDELMARCAALRNQTEAVGHALGQKVHEADRWVAATTLELGLQLVSGDAIFDDVPGLDHHRIRLP